MPITLLTAEMQTFIEANFLTMTKREIGARLGVQKSTVCSYLKRKKLSTPKEIANKHRANSISALHDKPQAGDVIIKQFYLTLNVNQLAIKINRSETHVTTRLKRLGLIIPRDIIEQRKNIGRFKLGSAPKNKGQKQSAYMTEEAIEKTKATRFQPGQPHPNSLHDGAITLRAGNKKRGGKPHYAIRISKGVWKELQIYNWENVNGPMPKGYVLACIDKDTLNCAPDNWKLMSRADNARRNNASKKYPEDVRAIDKLLTELNNLITKKSPNAK